MSTFQGKKNNAKSKIATVGGIDGSTNPVTFAVTTGEGAKFPSSNFSITIDNEILLCTSRTGDNLTCTRAQESTTIAAHSQNADVELRITAAQLVEYETAINTLEAQRDGWTSAAETWAYASATTITVPSGAASKYVVGDKIRLKQGAGYKYFYIVGVANTTLTVTGGSDYTVANSAITDAYYSHQENPIGFPSRFTYTPTLTGDSVNPTLGSSTLVGKFTVQGGLCFLSIRYTVTTGGSFNAGSGIYRFSLPVTCAVNGEPHNGWGALVDYGTSLATCYPEIWSSGTTVNLIKMFDGSGIADISLTWANNDKVWLQVTYPI